MRSLAGSKTGILGGRIRYAKKSIVLSVQIKNDNGIKAFNL